jgi:hypothetical protein
MASTNVQTSQDKQAETLSRILKKNPTIWRATGKKRDGKNLRLFNAKHVLPSNYPELDNNLHYGGWPRNALIEIGLPNNVQAGIGEVRLLLPALANILKRHYAIWIAPPFLPYNAALLEAKLNTDRLIVVDTKNLKDSLWSAEQAIKSGTVKALFTWLNTDKKNAIKTADLRRLQLASKAHGCWSVLFRNHADLSNASPAPLRIALQSHPHSKLGIDIIKQPGGWAGQSLNISLVPHYENWQRLPSELLPSYTQNQHPIFKRSDILTSGINTKKLSSASIAQFQSPDKIHSA